ncbi:MAG: dTDP-4-dehydrorhamnose reductase [Planctomycetes bacterium]|nr:dTDP-4-dehydrorhamnose reductase [Planctomycetota bacterium]
MAEEVHIFGCRGLLGGALRDAFARGGWSVSATDREVDVRDADAVARCLEGARPGVIVNAAAYTDVDRAEREPDEAFRLNATAVQIVAARARRIGAKLIHITTDYAYDGRKSAPYVEEDPKGPRGAYARSKVAGEILLAESGCAWLLVRTGGLYGAGGRSFAASVIARARTGRPLRVVADQTISPTWVRPLAVQIERLARADVLGEVHATCGGEVSWYAFARHLLDAAGLPAPVEPIATAARGVAPRPAYSVLANRRLRLLGLHAMPSWREALGEFLAQGGLDSLPAGSEAS